jgi:hypothetical protein
MKLKESKFTWQASVTVSIDPAERVIVYYPNKGSYGSIVKRDPDFENKGKCAITVITAKTVVEYTGRAPSVSWTAQGVKFKQDGTVGKASTYEFIFFKSTDIPADVRVEILGLLLSQTEAQASRVGAQLAEAVAAELATTIESAKSEAVIL